MTAAQVAAFRARWRELLAACPPWTAEQRAEAERLAVSVRMRQARDAARDAAERAPARTNARATGSANVRAIASADDQAGKPGHSEQSTPAGGE